jgi:signal transduction histidine kinase
VAQTFADGEVHCSEEVVIDDADNEINVIVYTSPIMDPDGYVTSVMEVSTDITVVRQLQDRLANVGALVASIAHSIKNLLDGLRGGIYITNLGFRDANQNKIESGWEMVQRNVERLSSMILDMLYCAKERVPNKQPLDINAIVGEVFDLYKPRADQSDVKLSLTMDQDLPLINAESKDIHSLFANLVGNAIDACCSDEEEDKEHEVKVQVRRDHDQMVVEVRDNGMGMDSETQKKLFNLFFSTKGSFGTGLGLLVAHKVAKEHGGNIAVESRPGHGSSFTVNLPLAGQAGTA